MFLWDVLKVTQVGGCARDLGESGWFGNWFYGDRCVHEKDTATTHFPGQYLFSEKTIFRRYKPK